MKIDWVAEWFRAMRECGEDISIVYGHLAGAAEHEEPCWYELPHDRFDGIGGLAHLMRCQGNPVPRLPVLRGDKYTFSNAVRGLMAYLPTSGVWRPHWRRFDRLRKSAPLAAGDRVVWHLFSAEETEKLIAAAGRAGVTVNTFLLFHLDAAVAAQLAAPASDRRWMVPVNLRGAVTRESESVPHMSFLAVDARPGETPARLQGQINLLKARAYHWGSWTAFLGSFLLGTKGMRKYLRTREKKQHGWTGIFSNLGVWESPDGANWIFCPNISLVYPVGAGCVTMNGLMALSVQLHEAFGGDIQASQNLLDAWKSGCLNGMRSPLAALNRI